MALVMFCGFVWMFPSVSFMLSMNTWLLSLDVLLCMMRGFVLRRFLYFLMVFLKFTTVI